ncbi:hypothetical protein K1719_042386 [Acacia pycnantha]|nr:hypothetical protein K1719_042386 [Acacia pycnantha]
MGSVTMAAMLASGCRSLGMPMALLRTLDISHSALIKHYNKRSLKWCHPRSSHNSAFASESSRVYSNNSTTTSSSNGYLKYDRLLPCPSQNCPPRVEHLVVSEGGPVSEYICKALDFPPLFVADLIQFGAVYYALVCPQPPPTATQEEIRIFKEATEPSVLGKRSSIKGKTIQEEAQKTFRVSHVDQFVEAGTYLRVHVHPKCFPSCYEIDWRSRIMAVAESYVVLDKPVGTSVCNQCCNISLMLMGDIIVVFENALTLWNQFPYPSQGNWFLKSLWTGFMLDGFWRNFKREMMRILKERIFNALSENRVFTGYE